MGEYSDDDELCEMVALSPAGRCAAMCLFGCISVMYVYSALKIDGLSVHSLLLLYTEVQDSLVVSTGCE